MTDYQWTPLARDYDAEQQRGVLSRQEASVHPLLPTYVTQSPAIDPRRASVKIPPPSPLTPVRSIENPLVDPLSALSIGDDPLSKTATAAAVAAPVASVLTAAKKPESKLDGIGGGLPEGFIPWTAKKAGILQKFTTNEHIGLTVTFIPAAAGGTVKTPVDRVQNRLEQLDQLEENEEQKTLQITQKEYVDHLEQLNASLTKAWANEERVRSLKIVIQCAKELTDPGVLKFYPSKFVLVTEILDNFGKLVFERIKKRSTEVPLPDNFTPDMVPEQAKETCRNWFYKIASIRELIPRLYVEMAILACYKFIAPETIPRVVTRLSRMLRGVGDPLVATYMRAYLARVAFYVLGKIESDALLTCFNDYIFSLKQVKSDKIIKAMQDQKMQLPEYLGLYGPAVEWLMQCIGFKARKDVLSTVLEKYKESNDAMVLHHILSSFQPDHVSSMALEFCALIKSADDSAFPKYQLYTAIGVSLSLSPPPKEQHMTLLNEIWKVVTKFKEPAHYISVAEAFIEFPVKNLTAREVNTMLGDILEHMSPNNVYEQFQPQLQSIVHKILTNHRDFALLFALSNFLPLLDLFRGGAQIEVNKSILEAFAKHHEGYTSDPVVINTMFAVGKIVHDSINSLSFADEIRQITRLLASFIHKVDFGRDVEKQLSFYVDCRQAFANIDNIKSHLVIGVANLAMKVFKIVKGNHNQKTAPFVRACIAYCFITIPSLEDVMTRLNLYLMCGQVALSNACVSQAEAFFESAISLIRDVPVVLEVESQVKTTEESLVTYMNSLMSALLVVPGSPEHDHGGLYLVNGLLKVIADYPWEKGTVGKVQALTGMLPLLASISQKKLLYHYDKVDSNDVLYNEDFEYKRDIHNAINQILATVTADINALKQQEAHKQATRASLDLFNITVAFAELNTNTINLAAGWYVYAQQRGGAEIKPYLNNSTEFLKTRESKGAQELYKKLRG